MGALADKHAELEAAIVAAGVDVADPALPPDPPCVLIRPADPWLQQAAVGAGMREAAYSILLVAGGVTLPGTVAALEALAEAVVPALDGLVGWSAAPASRAQAVELAGGTHLVAELRISALVKL